MGWSGKSSLFHKTSTAEKFFKRNVYKLTEEEQAKLLSLFKEHVFDIKTF